MGVDLDLGAVVQVDSKREVVGQHLAADNHKEDKELVQDEVEGNKVAAGDTLDMGYILQALEYKVDRA